jgi:hypothetical protein
VRKLANASLLALAVLALAPARAAAGPWTPEPGHGYLKLWLKETCNCGFPYMAGDGRAIPIGFYDELFVNAYAEVGIVPSLAAWVHWPVLTTFFLEDPRTGRVADHAAVGDPTVALRWRFLRVERFVSAIEVGVRFPFAPAGVRQPVYSAEPGNPEVGGLRIGTGVWDVPLALSIGYAWDGFYLAASGGFVARSDSFDPVVTWSAEGGGTFQGGLSLRVRLVGWHPVGIGDPALRHESPSGIGSGTAYTGFAVEIDHPIAPDWWLGGTIEGGGPGLARQTGGPVITLYVATRFSLIGGQDGT